MQRLIAVIALALAATGALAQEATHRVAVHVDQDDPRVMRMALNNVANMRRHYAEAGETLVVEIVTYGPGVAMLIEGESPVADRIETMAMEMPELTLSACGNTLDAMEAQAGQEIPLMAEATVVPSGAVRLIELQEDGYAYLRP